MRVEQVLKLTPAERFVYWIKEREKIRLARAGGFSMPWTDDEILHGYRFCNVRRSDDKVSLWLLKNWYLPHKDHDNTVAAAAIGRMFNLPETLSEITSLVYRNNRPPDWNGIITRIQQLKQTNRTVFNAAYIVSTSGNKADKIEWVVQKYVRPISKMPIKTDTIRGAWEQLLEGYGFSSFMAGQVSADLRHALTGDWSDAKTWAPVGPGSARGLARLLYPSDWRAMAGRYLGNPEVWLTDFKSAVLTQSDRRVGIIGSTMEAMDWQNCLCEFDKYSRALFDEGRPKQKYPSKHQR